jgi:hypothetical protein
LTNEARDDLKIFIIFLRDENSFHPIPPRPCHSPLAKKVFSSDAAGFYAIKQKVGAVSIGLYEDGKICFAKCIFGQGISNLWNLIGGASNSGLCPVDSQAEGRTGILSETFIKQIPVKRAETDIAK